MTDAEMVAEIELPPNTWVLILIQGIVAMVIGALLLFSPVMTTVVLVQVLAWFWIIAGAIGLISIVGDRTLWGWKLFSGLLGIFAGLFVVGAPLVGAVILVSVYIIVLAVNGIITGGVDIYRAFKGSGWGTGLIGVLNIAFGGLLLAFLPQAALVAPWVFGVIGVAFGIAAVIAAVMLKKQMSSSSATPTPAV